MGVLRCQLLIASKQSLPCCCSLLRDDDDDCDADDGGAGGGEVDGNGNGKMNI